MKVITMACTKKILFKTNSPKNGAYQLWINSKFVSKKFSEWKGLISTWEFYQLFVEKKFLWGNSIFLAFRPFFSVWLGMVKLSRPLLIGSLNSQDMISFMITTGSLNSQDMISFMITTGSLNNQDMTRIFKQ